VVASLAAKAGKTFDANYANIREWEITATATRRTRRAVAMAKAEGRPQKASLPTSVNPSILPSSASPPLRFSRDTFALSGFVRTG